MNKIVKNIIYFGIPSLAVGFYLGYKYGQKKNAPDEKSVVENKVPSLESNHFTDRIDVKKSDGEIMKGYPFPKDMAKLKFPTLVVSLPNNKLGIDEASAFEVSKNQVLSNTSLIKIQGKEDKVITEKDLIENTLIL